MDKRSAAMRVRTSDLAPRLGATAPGGGLSVCASCAPTSHSVTPRSPTSHQRAAWLVLLAAACLAMGCSAGISPTVEPAPVRYPALLSEYGLWTGTGATQEPAEGVIPYDLNSALFSDYALKFRFVKLPAGTSASYHEDDSFSFPVGTVIAKTFAYPADMRQPESDVRLIETRILRHDPDGWVGLPYIWNEEQTEAHLKLTGGMLPVSWIHGDGEVRSLDYLIPNANQCKGCHKEHEGQMLPIGPKARHLNRDFIYHHGTENQLDYWSRTGALEGSPPADEAPRLAAWDDPTSGTLDERARAWLEINCAHCHNPAGPARNSGLDLLASQKTPVKFGIDKTPVAAGRGSGGFRFAIAPGQPDQSIMVYRLRSLDPGVAMPELGRASVHVESLELIRQWIAAMSPGGEPADAEARAPLDPTGTVR